MNKLPDILKYLLNLIDNDEKRINITESPTNIFLLGYYYSKIEKSILNSKIDNKINLNELISLIENEDYYKIYTYLQNVTTYYEDMISKYSF